MNIELLVIISFLIVLFVFIISTIIHKINEKQKNEKNIIDEKNIKKIQEKQMENFFKIEVGNFFEKHQKNYENINENEKKVSDLNSEFKKEINHLIQTNFVRSILKNKQSKYYEHAMFLKKLETESPFVWLKKYKKEIKEYYEN